MLSFFFQRPLNDIMLYRRPKIGYRMKTLVHKMAAEVGRSGVERRVTSGFGGYRSSVITRRYDG